MRRLDEEVVHQHYCEANHKQGRLLSFDKLHTNLPSVHATDFQLDLRPGSRGGVLHQLMLCFAKNSRA